MTLDSPLKCAGRALALAFMLIALLAVLMLAASAAHAQSEPPFTFGASVTEANGQLTTTLTWEAEGAIGCTAFGHPNWEGPQPASGSVQLPTITMSGTYPVRIDCDWPAITTALLKWTPPTKNTDGSPFTDPATYRVAYGRAPDQLTESIVVDRPSPPESQFTVTGLTPGDWYFALFVTNSRGAESGRSNVAKKTIAEAQTRTRSLALTVNPIPSAVNDLTAE